MSKARLLWIGFTGKSNHAYVETLKRLWDKDLVEFCVATGVKAQRIDNEVLSEPLISHNEVLYANYGAIESNFSESIDSETSQKFSSFEGETLRMMDRLRDRDPNYKFDDSFDSRRKMFIRHCSFWFDFFNKKKISHVVFHGTPHEVFTFVIYKIAQSLSIQTIILSPEKTGTPRKQEGIILLRDGLQSSVHQSVFFVSESIEDIGHWRLSEKIKSLDDKFPFKLLHGNPFSGVSPICNQPVLPNLDKGIIRSYVRSLVKEILLKPKRPVVLQSTLKNSFLSVRQYLEHIRLSDRREDQLPSILFCLAFQPEESTSPRAGIFVEQKLAINAIARVLPTGWILRVREHPDQYGRRCPRPAGYLREISKIANVAIVPIHEPSYRSLESARVVAASAGTMCLEAWVRGIPLLLFGHMLLKIAPSVFFIESHGDLKRAIDKITSDFVRNHLEQENFKSWTTSNSFVGSLRVVNDRSLLEATINNLEGILERWFFLTSSAPDAAVMK